MSGGEKRASKTKRGCLQARQAGNASLPGLSPSHCSLAILLAHTRLNLTAPLSHSSSLFICPSSPSFCLSLYYTLHSFDHILIYSLFFCFVTSAYPSFHFIHTFLLCHLYHLALLLHFEYPFFPSQRQEPLLWSEDRNGLLDEMSGVRS